jgi:protein-disulfide isomerase
MQAFGGLARAAKSCENATHVTTGREDGKLNRRVLYALGVLVVAAIAIGVYFMVAARNAERAVSAASEASVAQGVDNSTALKETPVIGEQERFLGDAAAKLTIVEYFSLGCPHCARFHKEILPQFKAEYLDTGKARLVFRDFPLDQPALAAAMIARCLPGEGYFAMVETLFEQQSTWHSQNAQAALTSIAKGAGLDQAKFDACLGDKTTRDAIVAGIQEAQLKFEVESTPTFVVGNRKLAGIGSYADFKATIEAQLAKLQ